MQQICQNFLFARGSCLTVRVLDAMTQREHQKSGAEERQDVLASSLAVVVRQMSVSCQTAS